MTGLYIYLTIHIKRLFYCLSISKQMKKPVLPVIQPKKHITTKTIQSNPSFLITMDHDKKHLRLTK